MKLERLKLADIEPYKNNPRKNDDAVNAVAESIRQCSYITPIIVDEDHVIIAGHAVSSVADKIRSFLHLSVPDEGPLTDYESWMPDFIGGLAKGIEKSRGMIENAMNGVTSDLTITPRVMAAQGSYSGSAASSGDLISGINTALNTALAGGGAAGDIVIPVYIGGDMIDEIVVTAQQRMNLRSGGR